jgi:putative nucleotidyltransferase with HDIG domain
MGLAVAVRIDSEFTGRLQLSVSPYLIERLVYSRHEPSEGLPGLTRLIRMDPGLCFMAMRLDRSMGSASQTAPPPGIDNVVRRIGETGIDAILAQITADQALNEIHHRQGLALAWLWRHCLATAMLAQGIAAELDFHPVEEAYIAGLLHDIGKIALSARTPAACAPMLADPAQANQLLEAEAQVAGADHGRIGAQLIRRHTGAWLAADAARYHTADPAKIIHALPLVQIVWAANRLAGDPQPSSETRQQVAQLLNLDPQQLKRLSKTTREQVRAVTNELGVDPDGLEKSRTTDARIVPLGQEIRTSTALTRVYGELLTATDRSAILRVLRQSLSVFMGIEVLIIFDHEPKSKLLIGRFAAGRVFPVPINQLRIPLSASNCLPAVCLAGDEPVDSFSHARRGELTIIDHQLMAYMQTDGLVCIPVRSGTGTGRSCLLLGIGERDWPWVEQQKILLTAITTAVSGALEREQQQNDQSDTQAADRVAATISNTRKIVHEINNPLSIIKNYLKVLTLRTDENAWGKNELRIIDEEINRVAGLIKSLTSPSEKIPIHLETVDVNATIIDILGLFRKSMAEGAAIRLHQDLDAHIPVIACDRNRLKQALINLLKNAMEAMPGKGTILVSTRMLRSPSRLAGSKDEAGQIKISICDDGPGIDEGLKNDLIMPNVTSKTGHQGLGLSIVHETVTHLKGSLLFDSIPGKGTCFHIELPVGDNRSKSGAGLDPVT